MVQKLRERKSGNIEKLIIRRKSEKSNQKESQESENEDFFVTLLQSK